MFSVKLTILFCACLLAATIAAPTTESPTTLASSEPTTTFLVPTPQVVLDASTSAPQTTSAAAPVTDEASKSANSTSPMSTLSEHSQTSTLKPNSTFTCYGRHIGYYADTELHCKLYHFCLLGDYNGEQVYQRISYLCLNETVFDQQALDCVEPNSISHPCNESASFFELSNTILRQTILDTHNEVNQNQSLNHQNSSGL